LLPPHPSTTPFPYTTLFRSNKANARKPADAKDYLGHGWAFAWPANRRILYNRASADLKGRPWSEKKKLIWWDPEAPGQKPEEKGDRKSTRLNSSHVSISYAV